MRKILALFCAMLFIFGLSGTAEASFILYDQESAFTASAGGSLSFESFEYLTVTNTENTDSIATDGFTISGSDPSLGVFNTVSGGAHATDGDKYIKAFTHTQPSSYTFTFNGPVAAFGLYITDINLEVDTYFYDWDFIDSEGNTFDFSETYSDASTRAAGVEKNTWEFDIFLGIIYSGEDINSFTISAQPTGNGLGFDSVYYGTPVPEPTTMLLLGTGLLGLAGFRRKSKRS